MCLIGCFSGLPGRPGHSTQRLVSFIIVGIGCCVAAQRTTRRRHVSEQSLKPASDHSASCIPSGSQALSVTWPPTTRSLKTCISCSTGRGRTTDRRDIVTAAGRVGKSQSYIGASGRAALRRWKNGVHPAGRRVPWPADSRSTAASSTDAVPEIV